MVGYPNMRSREQSTPNIWGSTYSRQLFSPEITFMYLQLAKPIFQQDIFLRMTLSPVSFLQLQLFSSLHFLLPKNMDKQHLIVT